MDKSVLGAAWAALLLYAAPAAAGSYTYTTLVFPGTSNAIAPIYPPGGINDNDQVAGSFVGSDGSEHGFIWSAGSLVQVDYNQGGTTLSAINDSGLATGTSCVNCAPSATTYKGFTYDYTTAAYAGISLNPSRNFSVSAINAAGTIVGGYRAKKNDGFIAVQNSTPVLIQVPIKKANFTLATGIDDNGLVVGYYPAKGDHYTGFTYAGPGDYAFFNPPKSIRILHLQISPAGIINGDFSNKKGLHSAFTYSGGQYKVLNYPGGTQTYAEGVTSSGTVVGTWDDSSNVPHGYVYLGGHYHSINYPGATGTTLFGTNTQGSLLGEYYTTPNQLAYFIAQCPQGQQPCTQ
jgi:uncharacterized membrane protein